MRMNLIAAILVATCVPAQVLAQAPQGTSANAAVTLVPVPRTAYLESMDGEFKRIDSDKNGSLTATEIQLFQRAIAAEHARARHEALFGELDSDRNGQISKSEFAKAQPLAPEGGASPLLGQADLNKDQRVSLVEYRTAKLGIFDRMDADKDGVVSVAELRAAGIVR